MATQPRPGPHNRNDTVQYPDGKEVASTSVCLYRDWAFPSFLLLNPAELARQRGTDGLEM
jgi:hypothetical protein